MYKALRRSLKYLVSLNGYLLNTLHSTCRAKWQTKLLKAPKHRYNINARHTAKIQQETIDCQAYRITQETGTWEV
jgi:hypothetical protein